MRGLRVNSDLCFGCRACSSVCLAGRITMRDEEDRRFLRFSGVCDEDCSRCQEVCPPGAIRLEGVVEAPPAVEISFALQRCAACGQPFAPEKALTALLPRVQEALGGGEAPGWNLCPSCRRKVLAGTVVQAADGRLIVA